MSTCGVSCIVSIQPSAVSRELLAHATRTALWHRLWPRYANGHATRMATLREWPRCANDAVR
ncbi:hypothetical protein [Moorena sp. SIO3I8]|uniref:hypothetical protein n=1 Tax=Moorena sp. SIO3I8 TaxID=2607833 RepID=UPI0013C17118|nr:hypothetical protein [Moorena sp. SIO3I8]NEO10512.1 hypothetical protein [Moorena sp. SIO3I8]